MSTLLFVWIGCAVCAMIAGQTRGRGIGDSFMYGLVLGPLGVLLVCLLPNKKDSDTSGT